MYLSIVCIELSTRYEFTQESSSSAKQEVDQLKEEVKVLSSQLLRQHNASLDSQVRYLLTVHHCHSKAGHQ